MHEAVHTPDLVLTAPAVVPIFVNVGAAVLPAAACGSSFRVEHSVFIIAVWP
ncbi:MAG: hypothetical protein R6X20_18515 [Phycisphaerae bacterium]